VFRLTSDGTLTKLVDFNGRNGANPNAGLMQANDGNFCGTTFYGGSNDYGTVFQLTTNGALTTLASFRGSFSGTDADGFYPLGGLVQANDGNLYGTTFRGGLKGLGTVFRVATNGLLTTLVSFNGPSTNCNNASNGAFPIASLLCATDGYLYGITAEGGTNQFGTVFKLTTNGLLATPISFDGTNGSYPRASLVQGRDGELYGTTYYGGTNGGGGTIFRIVRPVSLSAWQRGDRFVLSWPTNAIGYKLQVATNLDSPVSWADSTSLPVTVGAEFRVTNTMSRPIQFNRLMK
jgi:uncharacterized repeat protein (TIGR03803 family)